MTIDKVLEIGEQKVHFQMMKASEGGVLNIHIGPERFKFPLDSEVDTGWAGVEETEKRAEGTVDRLRKKLSE